MTKIMAAQRLTLAAWVDHAKAEEFFKALNLKVMKMMGMDENNEARFILKEAAPGAVKKISTQYGKPRIQKPKALPGGDPDYDEIYTWSVPGKGVIELLVSEENYGNWVVLKNK